MMDERRRLPRRLMLFYSRVFNRKTGMFLGYLGNMNDGGLMIISDYPIEIGPEFSLRIDLPEDNYSQAVLNFEAKSVWCKKDIDPNFYNTGYQFTAITDDSRLIVEQIIADYGFRD